MINLNRALCGERETMLCFAFHLGERIARHEKVRGQFVSAIGGVSEVADRVCRLERAAQQIAAGPDMSRPGQHTICKVQIGPGLETRQSASFDQVIAELTEAIKGLIVAEARAGDHAKSNVGDSMKRRSCRARG